MPVINGQATTQHVLLRVIKRKGVTVRTLQMQCQCVGERLISEVTQPRAALRSSRGRLCRGAERAADCQKEKNEPESCVRTMNSTKCPVELDRIGSV